MHKDELLRQITQLARDGQLQKPELDAAFAAGQQSDHATASVKKAGIVEVLAYIGGGIIFLGISVLLAQYWNQMDAATRLFATLGVGIGCLVGGILLGRDERSRSIAPALHLVAALTVPTGMFVLVDSLGIVVTLTTHILISGLLLVLYGGMFWLFRQTILLFFAILFGTWLFYGIGIQAMEYSSVLSDWRLFAYQTLTIGVAYCLLGQGLAKIAPGLRGALFGLGSLSVLSAAFALSGFGDNKDVMWELVFPMLLLGSFYLSVSLKSSSFLTFGALFLVLYVYKITSEYFTDTLGWPISLMIIGGAMIGASYLALTIKRKYLSKKS